ncbi:MAG: DUF47 family protein [Candidatus Micrarchaeota archaeon]
MGMADWFKKRNEANAVNNIRMHIKLVHEGLGEFEQLVDGKDVFDKLKSTEREADDTRRKILIDLAEGALEPEDKRDLMGLARKVDDVLNKAFSAGKLLKLLKVDKNGKFLLKHMTRDTARAVSALGKAVEAFSSGNKGAAMSLLDEVGEIEREVDAYYADSLKFIMRIRDKCHPAEVILLHELFLNIENACDACRDAGERLKIIIVANW